MADFRQTINPTSDPNYLRQSKEPDRIKPLEQVSRPADTIADASFGTMLQGIGNTAELGLSAVDNKIKSNLKVDAHNLIDPIQDSHGSSLDPTDVTPIAGTGAKGRARVDAAQKFDLFGSQDGGSGSNSYAPTDAARDYSNLPAAISGGDKPLPPGADIELNRVSRMNDAYLQGTMSDSYYNAQLVAVTKELKSRYPGYRDEVDSAVSGITGVQPANALRKSLLSDLNAQAAARAQSASSADKELTKNASDITSLVPDFFSNRAKYAGSETRILTQAYQLQAERANVTASSQRLALDASQAGSVATDSANLIVRTAVAQIDNWSDPAGDGKTMNQKFNAIMNKPGGATPEEIGQLSGQLERVKSQTVQAIATQLASPISGQSKSIASHLNDPGKLKSITETAILPIDTMLNALKNGDYRAVKIVADQLSLTQNKEAQRQIDSVPSIKFISGLSKAGGEALAGTILQQTNLLPQLTKSLAQSKVFEVATATADKPPPGLSTQVDAMNKAGVPVNGPALKALVDGNMKLMQSDKFGPDASANAVRNMFDQKFFANLNEGERMKTWQWMGSPENTARVAELDKSSPGLMQQYSQWMKYAFQTTTTQGISNAKDAMDDPRFTPKFNPETMQIELAPKPGLGPKGILGNINQVGNGYVNQVNQGLRLMLPMWKAQGADPKEAAMTLIQDMGIDLNKKVEGGTNPILHNIGSTIRSMFMGPDQGSNPNPTPAPKPGKQSLDTGSTPLHDVIGQAESGGDYNSVFGFKKGSTRDLSSMTIGETMAMQKHNTDNGQESSAVGKYQFLRKTLASLVKEGAISADDHLTPDVQDMLATKLMERRGLNDYRSGKLPKSQFLQNLSQEWAGLPSNSGLSYYDGDGLNKSQVSLPKVLASIEQL